MRERLGAPKKKGQQSNQMVASGEDLLIFVTRRRASPIAARGSLPPSLAGRVQVPPRQRRQGERSKQRELSMATLGWLRQRGGAKREN